MVKHSYDCKNQHSDLLPNREPLHKKINIPVLIFEFVIAYDINFISRPVVDCQFYYYKPVNSYVTDLMEITISQFGPVSHPLHLSYPLIQICVPTHFWT